MDYKLEIEKAKEFWGVIAKENGWKLTQGVTVWVKDDKVVDTCYNPENSLKSYIVDYDTEKVILEV
jgi:hypothetical protein